MSAPRKILSINDRRINEEEHGNSSVLYETGCRCANCVVGQRERVARNRAERLASGRLSHGTRSAYDAGCRCDPCRQARRNAYQRLKSEYPQNRKEQK